MISKSALSRALVVCICLGWIAQSAASTNHHVLLITIDGFAAYLFNDPKAPIPNLRKLASEGTVAEGMRVSNPSVTWPNHTTLVTGVHPAKHSVLFNGVLTRGGPGKPVRVDPRRDKSDLVAVPTLYDHLHRAGYRTADINWPCTRAATSLHDSFPDVPDQVTHMTPRLRNELVTANVLEDATDASFLVQSAARKDQIWTAAALHVLKERRPNFMLLHMLITDSTQHKYGPQSPAAYIAAAMADAQVGEVVRVLEATGMRERTTIFVTADHGFERALKLIAPNVLFRRAGLLTIGTESNAPIATARAQIISEGGTALVYFTDPATKKEDAAKVMPLLRAQEGIAAILQPEQFASLGLPDPASNSQMGDLILVAADGYAFNNDARAETAITAVTLENGSQGHHGYISTNPKMNAVFIAAGRGIKRGEKVGMIDNIDVAPTIAHLFGRELPEADGKVLRNTLVKP